MRIVDTPPDEFLASFDGDVRTTMQRLDELVVAALPGRRRVLWTGKFWGGTDQSIIGYGKIVQPRPRGDDVEWFLVGLARQSRNYSVYLNAVENGAYLAHSYGSRLGKVKLGAASIGFTKADALDLDVFADMLSRAHDITPPDE